MTPTILSLDHKGEALVGELTLARGNGPHAAVLIFHSGLGLSDFERDIAAKLAALGYAALAVDMYGGDLDGSPEAAGPKFAASMADPAQLRARAAAWLALLAARPEVDPARIAAVGYCFGGLCALELARSSAALAATVSFHGLLSTTQPAARGAVAGEIMARCASDDPFVGAAQVEAFREEMATAGVRCHVTIFADTPHGFTNPRSDALGREGIGYHLLADQVSWAGTVALLETCLTRAAVRR